jgi:hypothetical protein
LVVVSLALLVSFSVFAQEPEPAEPQTQPKPVQPKEEPEPEEPKEQPRADEGKIVIYLDIKDYVDKKPFKWRMTEFLIAETLKLANPENKEKWKEGQRKQHDWSKFSKKKREKKIEKDYHDLRKRKGVDKLKYTHIKVIQWRPKPKEAKEDKDKDKDKTGDDKGKDEEGGKDKEKDESGEAPHNPGDDEDGEDEDGEGDGEEPDESGEPPHSPEGNGKKPGNGEEKPEKPAPKKKWVDPRETADYLILGEGRFKKGKQTKYFGETVEWQSIGELDIRVVRRIDGKVIARYNKKKLKPVTQGDPRGQGEAHTRCMRVLGKIVASKIAHLPELKKKKK